jgi:branched-chain amino acid transport system ATP-binding protein
MAEGDAILKLSNIESYYGPIMAIRGFGLEVPQGQIVAVLGANGAGKTTVLKTVSGVLDPQKGTVEFQGRQIERTRWRGSG